MNINSVFNRRPVQGVRPGMIKADNKFGELLEAKANRTDTFSKTFSSAAAASPTPISAEQLSSVNETQRKLDKIAEDIKNTDYSGMTKSEIYADIEGRYADAFDDFYATRGGAFCKDHIMIQD